MAAAVGRDNRLLSCRYSMPRSLGRGVAIQFSQQWSGLLRQSPQALEELLVSELVKRPDIEIDVFRKQRGDELEIGIGLLLSDLRDDRGAMLGEILGNRCNEVLAELIAGALGTAGIPGLELVFNGRLPLNRCLTVVSSVCRHSISPSARALVSASCSKPINFDNVVTLTVMPFCVGLAWPTSWPT